MVKTVLPKQGARIQSLVWELRSHMLHSMAQKIKKIKPNKQNVIRLLYKNKSLFSLPEVKHGDNLSFGPPLQKVSYTW